MTLSLCAPIVVLRPAGLSDGEALTRTFQSFPVQRLRPAHPKSVRDFTAPGTVLIRGLSRASCLFHHAARQLADCLHVLCSSALLHVPNIGMEIEACGARKPSLWSAEVASGYVRRMVERETRGWGDQDSALSRLEARYGIPFWSLKNIRTGRAKTVEAGLFARIRAAYLDLCERQVSKLQHEIALEKAMNEDDTLEDLEREASRLAARIAQKKEAGRVGR